MRSKKIPSSSPVALAALPPPLAALLVVVLAALSAGGCASSAGTRHWVSAEGARASVPAASASASAPASAPEPPRPDATGAPGATPPAPDAAAAATRPAIVQAGAPVLRQRAKEVPLAMIRTPEFQVLIGRMIETMRAAPGVGLAGPQIGVPWRVIVLEDREELMARSTPAEVAERRRVSFGPRVFVNPKLRAIGTDRATFFEGCLSVEGYAGVVERDLEVEVTGLDEHGTASTWRVRGWPARILQHELDHLDGRLYVDRMLTRSFSTGAQAKALYGGKPMSEILKMIGTGDGK